MKSTSCQENIDQKSDAETSLSSVSPTLSKKEDLCKAAKEGKLEILQSALLHDASGIHTRDNHQNTLLHLAIRHKKLKVMKWLLDEYTAWELLNTQNATGNTPLHVAIRYIFDAGRYGINSDTYDKDNSNNSAIFLVEHGARMSVSNNNRDTPIHVAAKYSSIQVLKSLLKKGGWAYFNTQKNKSNETPYEVFKKRNTDENANTLFFQCKAFEQFFDVLKTGNIEILDTIYNQSPFIFFNLTNQFQETPLHIATKYACFDLVERLLNQYGSYWQLYTLNDEGNTPISAALKFGYTEILKLLMTTPDFHSIRDREGKTPLQLAIEYGQDTIVAQFHKTENFQISDFYDNQNETPFFTAIRSGNVDLVKCFLSKEVNIVNFGYGGNTAIHIAATQGNQSIIKLLIESGADLEQINDQGQTAYDVLKNTLGKKAADDCKDYSEKLSQLKNAVK